jgi:hypothetical protein
VQVHEVIHVQVHVRVAQNNDSQNHLPIKI